MASDRTPQPFRLAIRLGTAGVQALAGVVLVLLAAGDTTQAVIGVILAACGLVAFVIAAREARGS